MLLYSLFTIFVFVILYILFEKLFNSPIILSQQDLLNHILYCPDDYFSKFNETDFKVRNVSSLDEYKKKIKDSTCKPSNKILYKLKKAINIANLRIKRLSYKYKNTYYGIDLDKLNRIRWKIGIVCNDNYENGMPHTRHDVIIISSNDIYSDSLKTLSDTLVHEKIHVYQKLYGEDVELYFKLKIIKKIKKNTKSDYIPANPDIDNYTYINNKNIVYRAKYLPNATSIHDIKLPFGDDAFEHPFEEMAYELLQ